MRPGQSNPDERRDRTEPVRENMQVQRHYWALERLGSWLLLILVLVALAGLFGHGLLSSVQAVSADHRLRLEYERFLRNGATTRLVIDAVARDSGPLSVQISGDLLDGTTVESVQPEPRESATVSRTGLQLVVQPDADRHVRLHLSLRADGLGLRRSQVRVGDVVLALNQFIYP